MAVVDTVGLVGGGGVDAVGVVDGDIDAEGIADEMISGGVSVVDNGTSTSIAESVMVTELSTSPAPPGPP
jgi:hypothetical protein